MLNEKNDMPQAQGWLLQISMILLKGIIFTASGILILLILSYLVSSNFFSKMTILKTLTLKQLESNKVIIELNENQLLNHTIIVKLKNANNTYLKTGGWKVPLQIRWEINSDGKVSFSDSKEKIRHFKRKGRNLTVGLFGIYEKSKNCSAKIFIEGKFSDLLSKNGSLEVYKYFSFETYLENKGQFGKSIIFLSNYPWFLFHFKGGRYLMIPFLFFGIVILSLVLVDLIKKRGNKK
jgi:hypothetical protein